MTMPFFGTTSPNPNDTRLVVLFKILGALNNANGGPVSSPTFFPEGSAPLKNDTEWKLLQKILGAANAISGTFSGETIGTNGDSFVFRNHGGYFRDPDTGLYSAGFTYSANGTIPPAMNLGSGYTFAAIPSTPVAP